MMSRVDRYLAMLLLVTSVSPALAEMKKFPSGHSYDVTCAKLPLSPGKEDARPGIDELSFGFSDTQQRRVDLIVGPVRSDEERVVLFDAEEHRGAGLDVSLSRVTGVLTIGDRSGLREATYLCESSPAGKSF
uniref:hypothetical protein n=1 Tax=Bradyrhizobium sp. (strain ORS 278) TaxID=114615 RepID=UPI0005A236BD|nr:hypothetical protein [Bradyrhizobium sp. ORS 278]